MRCVGVLLVLGVFRGCLACVCVCPVLEYRIDMCRLEEVKNSGNLRVFGE